MLITNIDIANEFFRTNADFLKPESVSNCHLVNTLGDYVYISCYIKTKTIHNYNVIYDPGLTGNLIKTKENAFAEDDYWSDFNKGDQFSKDITNEGLGAALVILDKRSLFVYNIYYFKDTYNSDATVLIEDVVEGKVVVNYVEYSYVFENGIFTYLTFVTSDFLKLDYLWVAYPYYGYDAYCNWHFINFKENKEAPIRAIDDDLSNRKYRKCYYDFEKCLFIFSGETDCITMDFRTLTSLTDEDKVKIKDNHIKWESEVERVKEKEQQRKSEFAELLPKLKSAVSLWDKLSDDFHINYLYYYYPITCEFVATKEEWRHRRLTWNFKNDTDKNIDPSEHKAAVDEVTSLIKQELIDSLGKELLQFITLVCVPASTSSNNYSRYYDFSRRICEETYMKNGFHHMYIMKDGMSKKHPDNHSGHSIQPVIKYEEDYFKGKYVLLFDDIVTKGETMLKYKSEMEKLGAIVIGGICLGKTRHERPIQSGQNTNEYDEELPF